MKLNKLLFLIPILLLVTSCGGGGSNSGGSGTPTVTLSSITVTPASPSIASETTEQFTATGTYSDNTTQDITTSVAWSSSTSTVATIDNAGLATAVAKGSTKITASSGSISGYATLTITSATLSSITVTPASSSIALGATEQFTATGTFSDNTTQVFTTLASWSSSSPSLATISNTTGSNGLATSFATGTTTIKATWNGVSSNEASLTVTPMDNVLTVTVNGSLCSSLNNPYYVNKPCVSVTICTPGTLDCQTIDDILLDTGDYGLRIFKDVLNKTLTQVTADNGGYLAECVQFGDGSSQWGPVQTAKVILGNESAITIPIHVIDSTFGTAPSACDNAEQSPADAMYNGSLGVGLFAQDCGPGCVSSANGGYYSCSDSASGSTCTPTTVQLSDQVQNTVSHLSGDNNGVILQLPSVPLGGTTSVNGILIFGIGTQSNNTPSGVTMYHANPSTGDFTTIFNGRKYETSFIDSGSNGLFFSKSSMNTLTTCTSGTFKGWYCPSSTLSLSATTGDYEGSPSGTVSFTIGNASTFSSSNKVFIELGAPDTSFDWGLPFFLGRSVYLGIENKTSSLGTGPYWAY